MPTLSADREMPFVAHLRELRWRLILSLYAFAIAAVLGYFLYHGYMRWLLRPFGETLYVTELTTAFMMRLRISIYAGFIISLPVHLYNLIAFIAPALSPRERRILGLFLGGSLLLTATAIAIGYYQILPLSIKFLVSDELRPEGVDTMLRFQDAVSFVVQLMFAFVLLFQLPLLMLVLMACNVVSRRFFLKFGRYFIIVIFILAAIFSPPDWISQVGLALPLTCFYYLAILIAKIAGFGHADD
jgi:sec-independent protein translocase protein TatC